MGCERIVDVTECRRQTGRATSTGAQAKHDPAFMFQQVALTQQDLKILEIRSGQSHSGEGLKDYAQQKIRSIKTSQWKARLVLLKQSIAQLCPHLAIIRIDPANAGSNSNRHIARQWFARKITRHCVGRAHAATHAISPRS